MPEPNPPSFVNLPFRPAPSEAPPNSDKKQAKYEAAVLARKADAEGWSDEKLTSALNDTAAKGTPFAEKPASTPAQVDAEEVKPRDTASEQEMSLEKRQETIRIIRQAEMEGWSDEKLVAALRIRLEIRQELRARAKTL